MTYSDQAAAVAANESRYKQILFLSSNYSYVGEKMESESALKRKSFAKIQTTDIRIDNKVSGPAGSQDLSVSENIRTVSDAERFAYVMISNEYPDAPVF